MKSKLLLTAAFSAMLALVACGGGGSDSPAPATPTPAVYDVPALLKINEVPGTGAEVVATKSVTVKYTGWLYNTTMTANKGAQFDSGTFTTVLASKEVIEGWVQGIPGMKVGGKRTLVIPSSLGYGTRGRGSIPANSALVFDIEVTAVQ